MSGIDLPFPFSLPFKLIAKIEYSIKKRYFIVEVEPNELKICTPKLRTHRKFFYREKELWYFHKKAEGDIDCWRIDKK